MATYEEIYGKRVEVLDTDPTLTTAYEGQVWYNSTTGTLKSVVSFGAYSSGGNMNAGVSTMGGGGSSSSQAISAKGNPASPPSDSNAAESYNGTGWASLPTTNVAMRNCAGASQSSTSAVVFGGTPPIGGQTELWDGSSWTNKTAMNNSRENLFGAGSGTAALAFGGNPAPNSAKTEEWSGPGNSWTNKTDMSQVRADAGAGGSVTSALVYGGSAPPGPRLATTEEYDGSSWSTKSNLNTTRAQLTGTGPNADNQIAQGGNDGSATGATERWDGTSWTTSASLSTARIDLNSGGTNTDAVAFGGAAPPSSRLTATEEFDFSINTVSPAAWATGGVLPSARGGGLMFGVGTQTATVIAAGANNSPPPDYVNTTLEYNGASWTSANAIGQPARNSVGSAGTATSGLLIGGYSGTSGGDTTTEHYDGTNWTNGGALNNGYESGGYFGTQTAAVACAGTPVTGNPTKAEEYNGASWTSISAIGTGRVTLGGFGTETAGVVCGGMVGYPGSTVGNTEEYNGESWSEVNNLITARYTGGPAQAGTQTAGMYMGGNTRPAKTAVNEAYDGTVWYSDVSLPAARDNGAGTGTRAAALMSGGYNPSITTETLEYSPSTQTITSKTLTTS